LSAAEKPRQVRSNLPFRPKGGERAEDDWYADDFCGWFVNPGLKPGVIHSFPLQGKRFG